MRKLSVPIGKTGLRLVVNVPVPWLERRRVRVWLRCVATVLARELEARSA